MIGGRERTERWIIENDVRDASGRRHAPHGIWTVEARLMVYVTFDSNPVVGRRAWYFFTHRLQLMAERFASGAIKRQHVNGSRDGFKIRETGAGYLFDPVDESRGIDRVELIPSDTQRDDVETSIRIVIDQLSRRTRIGRIWRAMDDDQLRGIDIFAEDRLKRYGEDPITIEVKMRTRDKAMGNLFLQLSETNPEGAYE